MLCRKQFSAILKCRRVGFSNPLFDIFLHPAIVLHGNMGVARAITVKVQNNVWERIRVSKLQQPCPFPIMSIRITPSGHASLVTYHVSRITFSSSVTLQYPSRLLPLPTRHLMIGGGEFGFGFVRFAFLIGERAARMKLAARRHLDQIGRRARD